MTLFNGDELRRKRPLKFNTDPENARFIGTIMAALFFFVVYIYIHGLEYLGIVTA